MLALGDEDLIEGVCGDKRAEVDARLAALRPAGARAQAAARRPADGLPRTTAAYPRRSRSRPTRPAALYLLRRPRACSSARGGAAPSRWSGSRRASPYGLEVARALGRELAACGVPVVSGLALGIDSAAHEGALAGGGLTVAVLPGGADVAYPRSKRDLHRRIAAEGLVVSEMPPGITPVPLELPGPQPDHGRPRAR